MADKPNLPDPITPVGQILIYQDGATRLQVRLEGRSEQRKRVESFYRLSVT